MTVIEKLKAESLRLRKERSPIASSITFALSEIDKVGKNSGNRETTEDEAIRVVQKLIATIDENLKVATDDGRKISFNYEKKILQSVLPQMASEEEVTDLIKVCMTSYTKMGITPKKGDVMKAVRNTFGAKVDMKRAGEIVTELYEI